MTRLIFFIVSALSLIFVATIAPFWPPAIKFLWIILPLITLGIYDINSGHNVLRNYPVVGHLRYMFEFIRPEIQQYFVATNLSGRPFNREIRTLVYQRAKHELDTHPFGTEHDIDHPLYQFAHHSIAAVNVPETAARVTIGEHNCEMAYSASRLNISAMSFGAISKNAVCALNLGAKMGGFAHNTGEGGASSHHLKEGGDLIWQIGTGYFGCRTLEGDFDSIKFTAIATLCAIKMIEIKLSQGAKPSHGGLLPAVKITPEIAKIRGIPMDQDCLSPPSHSSFSSPETLLYFVKQLRELSGGKPIGFKLCIGVRKEFMGICKAMLSTGITPDFITIDGAEGGTGAAPLEFTNRLGLPINEGLAFAHNCLVGVNLRDKIRLIASGKIATGFDMVMKIALGADLCNVARPMLFAVGCIQALRCHANTCPTGVTTQDPRRIKALVIKRKAPKVANYHRATLKSFLELTGAMGVDHPDGLSPDKIFQRVFEGESKSYADVFHYIEPGHFLTDNIHPYYKTHWEKADVHHF